MRTVNTETGGTAVQLSRREYQDLVDIAESTGQRRALAERPDEFLEDSALDAYLAAPTPLAYWRERRGMSPEDLARAARITDETLAALEAGTLVGDVASYQRLARCLRISLDSVVPTDDTGDADTAAAAE